MKILFIITLFFLVSACSNIENGDNQVANQSKQWQGYTRLTSEEIIATFSDVIDHATVVDGAGGKATNHWFKDGRFTSQWKVANKSGALSGTWFVENDLRCVSIDGSAALAYFDVKSKRCGPIYAKNGKFYSVNKSGSVHGIHELTDL